MISVDEARKMAMAFPETVELPHFERTSFRAKKKIFMTMDVQNEFAVLKFTPEDQSVFARSPDGSITPIPNKWGLQGWTKVNLKKVKKTLFKDALECAWLHVAPKKLSSDFKSPKTNKTSIRGVK